MSLCQGCAFEFYSMHRLLAAENDTAGILSYINSPIDTLSLCTRAEVLSGSNAMLSGVACQQNKEFLKTLLNAVCKYWTPYFWGKIGNPAFCPVAKVFCDKISMDKLVSIGTKDMNG